MSPAELSRRCLVAGVGASLVAAEASSTGLPVAFDPRAFVDDLLATGHSVALHQPVWVTGDPDEDLRPYYWVYPRPDGGFNRAYRRVMAKWADALDAEPDHVAVVVAHLRERIAGQEFR